MMKAEFKPSEYGGWYWSVYTDEDWNKEGFKLPYQNGYTWRLKTAQRRANRAVKDYKEYASKEGFVVDL